MRLISQTFLKMTFISSLTYKELFNSRLSGRQGWGLLKRIFSHTAFSIFGFAALRADINERSNRERLQALFISLIGEYEPIIRKTAFSYSATREEFDDLRQDILLNIWKGLPGFRDDSKPSTWIWRVALNTCVSTIRARRRSVTASGDESLLRSVAAEEADEESMEQLENLHRAISRLSPDDKAIITLRLEEKSYEEIAELMGMNRNTVATRLRRIREHLSTEIKKA